MISTAVTSKSDCYIRVFKICKILMMNDLHSIYKVDRVDGHKVDAYVSEGVVNIM